MKLKTLKKRLKGFSHVNNVAPNHVEVSFENGRVLLSYDTIIAIRHGGKTYLTNSWDYSVTTGKHRNSFLGEGIAETRNNIKAGIYKILQE